MDFRPIIIAALARQNMPRRTLARLAAMTPPKVSDYLNGRRDVNGATLARMFAALKIVAKPTAQGGRPQAGKAKGR